MFYLLRFLYLLLSYRFFPRVDFFSTAKTHFRAWPLDLDMNFHVNNGGYFSFMDMGRFDLVFRNGVAKVMRENGFFPVVASQTIRYRKSIGPFQKFEVRTRLVGWDEKFFFMEQVFHSAHDEILAHAIVKARFIHKRGGGVLPSKLVELCGQEPTSPKVPEWILEWASAESRGYKEFIKSQPKEARQ